MSNVDFYAGYTFGFVAATFILRYFIYKRSP